MIKDMKKELVAHSLIEYLKSTGECISNLLSILIREGDYGPGGT